MSEMTTFKFPVAAPGTATVPAQFPTSVTASPPPQEVQVISTPAPPPADASGAEIAALRAELAALREELRTRPVPQATASQAGGAPYPGSYAWHLADGRVLLGQPSPVVTHWHDPDSGQLVLVVGVHAEDHAPVQA